MSDNMTVIQSFNSEVEAQMAQGRLESAGIESIVTSDDCAGLHPHLQSVYGVKLLVFEEDLERAQAILEVDLSDQ